ncbi:hypothetical protein EVAR_56952_1 [Eumeta japonica]|uniref:Uncharacterized protein n=1 Tax=Eumeta variegata TaxID=151549 RepID=A0A4C1YLZ8_EUMVA|nr:hypothetical protein EVAR_56952_1 [Eumeta japonica]
MALRNTLLTRVHTVCLLASYVTKKATQRRCPHAPKNSPIPKGHAAPSAHAHCLNYTKLRPSSNGSPQRPAHDKSKLVIHREPSETALVDNFDYRHQRARDSREKISPLREFDGKTYFLNRTLLTSGGDLK